MIAHIKGKQIEAGIDNVVVDVNGVGYELHCSQQTILDVQNHSEVSLYVYTAVREDAITLYGFSSVLEKQLFLALIKVNGVGPKMAITILSGAPVSRIYEMIESEDVKALTQLPKVGKKTAEQLILSLKGKLPKLEARGEKVGASFARIAGPKGQIVSALVNLGFKAPDVERVVEEFDAEIDIEDGVRKGLQLLTQI